MSQPVAHSPKEIAKISRWMVTPPSPINMIRRHRDLRNASRRHFYVRKGHASGGMSGAPSYTSEPGPDERRLAIALPSGHSSSTSFGTLIQRGSGLKVALHNQQDGARRATYGRNASVAGEVSLSTTNGVTSVLITLEGKATGISGLTKLLHTELLHESLILWENGRTYTCPSILPFNFVFPAHFTDGKSGPALALPPSYDSTFSLHDMRVRCVYELIVQVMRSRWVPNKSLVIDINYVPRALPARTVMDAPFPFFDTIKSAAEEWFQMNATMASKAPSRLEAIHCTLFIPSIRAFTKETTIPFFLQLSGSIASMLALERHTNAPPRIFVAVKRQVVIDSGISPRAVRTYTIGTGLLNSVPPGYVPVHQTPGESSMTDDYEGEIQFLSTLSTSSFDIAKLRVTDFVVLTIEPQGSAAFLFERLTQSEGIRIVTG
ncbi:unnamed protein product [Peniophora sp. CBMAI 1063]|nr:unnamed protein product [Peniophora sp. CBMAI 1063]